MRRLTDKRASKPNGQRSGSRGRSATQIAAATSLAAFAVCCNVRGATLTWDPALKPATPSGGTGTWITAGSLNWATGGTDVAWTDTTGTDTAIFGTTGGSVTLSGTNVANSVFFNAAGYTLSGGTLLLGGTSPSITTNYNAIISSVVRGTAGFVKNGIGTLTLIGANTNSGTTTISGGELQIGNGGTSGSLASGAVVDNALLSFNFGSGAAALVLPANVSGTGSLSVLAPSTTFGGTIALSGSQTYNAGNLAATYQLAGNTNLGGSSISLSGVFLQSSNTYTINLDTSAFNGPINLDVALGVTNVNYGPGGLVANAGTGTLTLMNTTGRASSFPSTSSFTGALNINDSIVNAGAIALHATGNSTVAGQFGLAQSLYGYNAFNVDAGSTMTVSAQLAGVSGIAYGGISKLGGGTLILTNGSNSYAQGLQLSGGTLQFSNNAIQPGLLSQGGYAVDFLANSTLKFDATDTTDISTGGQIDIANGVTATFDTNGSTQTLSSAFALKSGAAAAVILNDSSVTPGTLILTANNAYTGGTTITAGTLQVGNGGSTGSIGTGPIVDNGTLAYNTSSTLTLPSGSGLTGKGNLSVIAPSTNFTGNVALSGRQTYNSGSNSATYLLNASTTLTGSAISLSGLVAQSSQNAGYTLALDTSATNGPINLNVGFSIPNVAYGPASFSANAGTGTLTLANTTGVNAMGFPVTSSFTGALNITDSIPNAQSIAFHATGNSTVAGEFGLGQNQTYYGSNTFNVDTGATMTVSAELDGVSGISYGGIAKTGGGTLVLTNAANSYGQGLTMKGGTVQFTNNALKASTSGAANGGYAANFQANSTLKFDATDTSDISAGGQINIASGVTATFDTNGSTQTFGTALNTGSGSAVVLNDSGATPGTLIVAGNNTYTGGTTITRGTLQVGNGGTTGSLGSGAIIDNGTLAYNFGSGAPTLDLSSASISVTGTGNLSVTAPSVTFGGNIKLGGSQSYTNGTTNFGQYVVTSNTTLTGSSIAMTGLVGQNTVSGSSLTLDTSAANGPIALNLGLSVVNVAYPVDSFTANAGTGALTLTNTTGDTVFPATSSFTGALNINDNIPNAGAIALHATGNSTVAGVLGLAQSLNGLNSFTVDAGYTMTVSAQLTSVSNVSYGGINKLGGGTLVLTNPNNNYAQGTVITAGTVRAEAATASLGTGPVTVSGGVLAGSGNTGTGPVTLMNTGTITGGTGASAANTPGTLTAGGGLTLSGGTYDVKLDLADATAAAPGTGISVNTNSGTAVPASDRLMIVGLISLPGTGAGLVISPVPISSGVSGRMYSFVIADATGSGGSVFGTGGAASSQYVLSSPANGGAYTYSLSTTSDGSGGEDLLLDVSTGVVPEPSSLLLAAVMAAPLALGRRRRRTAVVD